MKFSKPVLCSLIGATLFTATASSFSPTAHSQNQPRRAVEDPFVVCIDPGHPSEISSGARAHGLSENRLNWQVAVRLMNRLNSRRIAWVTTKTQENQRVTNRARA